MLSPLLITYAPTVPAASTLHSVCDPNGGTLYKDAPATNPATLNGDTVLSNKDAISGLTAAKIGTLGATLDIGTGGTGVKALKLTTAGTNRQTGFGLKWSSGTVNPGNCVCFICYIPDGLNKNNDDLLIDPGLSTAGSINQYAQDSGWLRGYNNSTFTPSNAPYLGPSVGEPVILAFRSDSGGQAYFRSDFYGTGGIATGLQKFTNARVVTSTSATGWSLAGRNAANLFLKGYVFFASMWNGTMSDAEVAAEIANIRTYLISAGMFTYSSTNTRLICDGDSNCSCIATSNRTANWGYLLQQGLITAGFPCTWWNLGVASRDATHLAGHRQAILDHCAATSGKVLLVQHIGENDLNGLYSPSTVYNNIKTENTALKAAASNLLIILMGVPSRAATTQATYDSQRTTLRTSCIAGGALADLHVDGYIDITGDSQLGTAGSPVGNSNFDSGDHVHYTDTGCTRVYNGTDGAFGSTLFTTAKNLLTPAVTTGVGKKGPGVKVGPSTAYTTRRVTKVGPGSTRRNF